jgi:GNAT superfamily N-acetyltransferase
MNCLGDVADGIATQFKMPQRLGAGSNETSLSRAGRRSPTDEAPSARRAPHDDIPRIMEIRHGVHENRLRDPASVTAAECAAFIDRAEMWAWVEDGQIQGFSAGDPRDESIWALFVDPANEGRGIGRALLALACDTVRLAGSRARVPTASIPTSEYPEGGADRSIRAVLTRFGRSHRFLGWPLRNSIRRGYRLNRTS